MELIDKSAVVAEIEKLQKVYSKLSTRNNYEDGLKGGRLIGYKDVLHRINNLEVEEVDLENEFNEYIEKQNAFTNYDNGEIKYYNGDSFNHVYDIYSIAKYFFELGLKTQKGE